MDKIMIKGLIEQSMAISIGSSVMQFYFADHDIQVHFPETTFQMDSNQRYRINWKIVQ